MKKIFSILVMLTAFAAFAQKFTFDIFAKYNSNEIESILLTNTKNDNYYLRIFNNENKIEGYLTDIENLKIHTFEITQTNVNNEIIFNFNYLSSREFELDYLEKGYKNYVFDFHTIENKDGIKKVKFKVFRNAKKKRPIMEYELEIKEYDKNLFPAFRICGLHPLERINQLNYNDNGIVIKANGKFITGLENNVKLLEYKEVNLELEVK